MAGKVPNLENVPDRSIARCEVYLAMYIAYISVSMPTPWAAAGPNGQLASSTYPSHMSTRSG